MKSSSIFIFITMAHTAQNNNKIKNLQRNLQIMSYNKNNQLEFLFLFLFLVLKQNTFITFPNQNFKHPKTQSESQPSQNPQHPTSTSTTLFSQQNMETSITTPNSLSQ